MPQTYKLLREYAAACLENNSVTASKVSGTCGPFDKVPQQNAGKSNYP